MATRRRCARIPRLAASRCPARLGATGVPGPVVTKGGLVFIPGGSQLVAFDKSTGAELWAGDLDERGSGNPMTYATRSGRQFVVVATGVGERATLVGVRAAHKKRNQGALIREFACVAAESHEVAFGLTKLKGVIQ